MWLCLRGGALLVFESFQIGEIRMRSPLIITALLFSSGIAQAAIVTIDFEGRTGNLPYTEDSFLVSQENSFNQGIANGQALRQFNMFDGVASDSNSFHWSQFGPDAVLPGTVNVTHTSGNSLDLLSIDAAFAEIPVGPVALTIIGTLLNGGGTVVRYLEVVNDIDTYDLSSLGLSGLSAVDFVAADRAVFEIDNIVLATVVPIPAAVWLFGSGLGLLGWFRRRQTA
jgi:hypothetical protein